MPTGPAVLGATSSLALYGKGIFTTVAIYSGEPFLWEKHWARLERDASVVDIDLSEHSETSTINALRGLLDANKVSEGRARITFLDESVASLWNNESMRRIRVTSLIMTADFPAKPVAPHLTLSQFRINSSSPLAGIKSCNYLEKIIARDDAKRRGFYEAIQLNERNDIASGTMSNVFWLKNGELFTPALDTGCLAGTTRHLVLQKLECKDVAAPVDVLRNADDIFLTSAGIGVIQVAMFDGRELAGSQHPIMQLMPRR